MQKKQLALLLISLTAAFMTQANASSIKLPENPTSFQLDQLKYGSGNIVVGNINTSITDIIKVKPDTAEFSITYITEGDTPNEASTRNVTNMKELKSYLTQLGIKDENLTTITYKNYQEEKLQPTKNSSKYYNSSYTIQLSITKDQFSHVAALLDEYKINDIAIDNDSGLYSFSIQANDNSENSAKQLAQQQYQVITQKLNSLGVNNISVSSYQTRQISSDQEMVKKYFVKNTIKIKVTDFDHLGKIITKAQELKMSVNNDIKYSVSDNETKRILELNEQALYNKLAAKAQRLIGQQNQLGVAINLSSNENINTFRTESNYYMEDEKVVNAGQEQRFLAGNVNIQAPAEFTIILMMSGTFEIVRTINK